MNVQALIDLLSTLPSLDAEVQAYDPDLGEMHPVSGAVYDQHVVELQTDDLT